jgi:hypothetical protein
MKTVKQYRPPKKLYHVSKYVFTKDLLLPRLRGCKGPKEYRTAVEMLEQYPDQMSQQVVGHAEIMPEFNYNFLGSDPFYTGNMSETVTPAEYLLTIKEGRSYGRHCAIIGPDNIALSEFNYEARNLNDLQRSLSGGKLRPRYWKHRLKHAEFHGRLPRPERCPGRVVALNSGYSHNYYHWMIEILPRLVTLQATGIEADWYVVDGFKSYQRQALEAFGIPLDRVIQPHGTLHLQAQELLVPSQVRSNTCREVGRRLISQSVTASDRTTASRIYIDRRNSRQVRNEVEFGNLLRDFGFQRHFLEDYSLSEQARLFHQAEVVLALHGAGLSNLIFARPGTRVVELMPKGRMGICFPDLSRRMGLHHWVISADRVGLHQDMLVPTDTLSAVLEEVTSSAPIVAAA